MRLEFSLAQAVARVRHGEGRRATLGGTKGRDTVALGESGKAATKRTHLRRSLVAYLGVAHALHSFPPATSFSLTLARASWCCTSLTTMLRSSATTAREGSRCVTARTPLMPRSVPCLSATSEAPSFPCSLCCVFVHQARWTVFSHAAVATPTPTPLRRASQAT